MLKILMSLLTIVLVSASAIGATRAYFTDSETSSGNTFSVGTLNVVIDGDGSSSSPYFNVSNMKPGDSAYSCLQVKNDGSVGMLFRAYVADVTDSLNLASQLDVTVTLRPPACDIPSEYNAYGPVNLPIWSGKLADLINNGSLLNNISAAFNSDGILEPDYAAVYGVNVSMPEETGNTYQGAVFTGSLKVDATQFANQEESSVQW